MFENLPLHPAIVHLPLGILALLPLLTLLVAGLAVRNTQPKSLIFLLAFVHLVLVGSSYAALETGEDQEHRVETVVSKTLIHEHEEKAEGFMIATVVCLVLAGALLLLPRSLLVRPGLFVLLFAQLTTLYFGYQVGHSGGELVYVHGAAKAYETKSQSPDPQ